MSLEAWGDEGDPGISLAEWDRVIDCAIDRAVGDPDLQFPVDTDPSLVVLEELPDDPYAVDSGWRFRVTYAGRSVEVFVDASILDRDDES